MRNNYYGCHESAFLPDPDSDPDVLNGISLWAESLSFIEILAFELAERLERKYWWGTLINIKCYGRFGGIDADHELDRVELILDSDGVNATARISLNRVLELEIQKSYKGCSELFEKTTTYEIADPRQIDFIERMLVELRILDPYDGVEPKEIINGPIP